MCLDATARLHVGSAPPALPLIVHCGSAARIGLAALPAPLEAPQATNRRRHLRDPTPGCRCPAALPSSEHPAARDREPQKPLGARLAPVSPRCFSRPAMLFQPSLWDTPLTDRLSDWVASRPRHIRVGARLMFLAVWLICGLVVAKAAEATPAGIG